MAVDAFLKIGDIKGESKDKVYSDWIEVLSWSWGMSQQGSFGSGGGGGAGKVNMQDLSLSKYMDMSSADIQVHCATGRHYPEATLVLRKAGDKPLDYLKIKLSDVLISSYQLGGSGGGDDRPVESLSLNFAKYEYKYTGQEQTGAAGTSPEFKFDVAGNTDY
jgi:type VI secretion system secreted protein Hcp